MAGRRASRRISRSKRCEPSFSPSTQEFRLAASSAAGSRQCRRRCRAPVRPELHDGDCRLNADAFDAREAQRIVAGLVEGASARDRGPVGSTIEAVVSRSSSGVPSGATLVTISSTEKNWLRNATLPGMTTRPVIGGMSSDGIPPSSSTGKNGSAAIEKLRPGRSNCGGSCVSRARSFWLIAVQLFDDLRRASAVAAGTRASAAPPAG